jgi:cytidylate kinase
MRQAADAALLDTTALDAEAAFEQAIAEVRQRLTNSGRKNSRQA